MNPLRRLVFLLPAAAAVVAGFFGFPDISFVFIGLAAVAGWSADGLLGLSEAERQRRPPRIQTPQEAVPPSYPARPAKPAPAPAPVRSEEGSDIFWEAAGAATPASGRPAAPVAEAAPPQAPQEPPRERDESDEYGLPLPVQNALVLAWGIGIVLVALIGIISGYRAAT